MLLSLDDVRCDLLKIHYLCGNKDNKMSAQVAAMSL